VKRIRRWSLIGLGVLVCGLTLDAARAPERQWSTALAIGAIHCYQRTAGPLLSRLGARCRLEPSCSHYAEAVLRRHGIVAGTWLAARRLARCGPWTATGTKDPPPQ
jgi:hypothetical protein